MKKRTNRQGSSVTTTTRVGTPPAAAKPPSQKQMGLRYRTQCGRRVDGKAAINPQKTGIGSRHFPDRQISIHMTSPGCGRIWSGREIQLWQVSAWP